MSENTYISTERAEPDPPLPFGPPPRNRRWRRGPGGPRRPRVRKLRLFFILFGLGVLAVVSTVFGMMMAVASDLPQIENQAEYKQALHNSYVYDDHWNKIGILAPPNNEVIDTYGQLGPTMRDAIISVEDRRFWTDPGVDVKGIARAFLADATGRNVEGASTIAEQFVKNALTQEDNRTVFEKLREAAMAFHLTHEWTKVKILTEYLNAIYFGNGAYGVESAARVYFGDRLGYDPSDPDSGGCGDPPLHSCASKLTPGEAALLAGMVANPSAFNPVAFPQAAWTRRDLVLKDMLHQHYINQAQYENATSLKTDPLPTAKDIEQPQEPPAAPYFTSWVAPQIISALEARGLSPQDAQYRAYYGGLKVQTTIDLRMQQAAEQAVSEDLPEGANEPVATLVAIDNKTGEVRAMVGGPLVNGQQDYEQYPFNLATEGFRQPGSAFKLFTLAVALQHGYGPDSVFDSRPLNLIVPNSASKEHYYVHNFDNEYSGSTTLQSATDSSDNSVFTQLGLGPGVGTRKIASMATAMGIRSPVSTNYAMIIGGLKTGVSTLDLAHAYQTVADGGLKAYDPVLGSADEGPIGIEQIQCPHISCDGKTKLVATPHYKRVIPASTAAEIHQMLQGVVQSGTGTAAAISGVDVAGKTGTTSNYGDAWFVGWTPQMTTAVWVGFPNKLVPMNTEYDGGPVEGGTFPANIWHTFMVQALQIQTEENAEYGSHPKSRSSSSVGTESSSGSGEGTGTVLAPQPSAPTSSTTPAPATGGTGANGGTGNAGNTGAGTGENGGTGNAGNTGAGTGETGGGAGNAGNTGAGTGGGTGGTTGGGSGSGGSGGAGLGPGG